MNILRIPRFLGLDPGPYESDTFEPPTTDHHSTTKSANFSPAAVAATTIRYRKDPSTGKLVSNANFHRWSDGSVTIQIGDQHYELQSKPLAPPMDAKPYQDHLDSHTYLAYPHEEAQMLQTIGHMNNQFTVRPNKDVQDDALERLQSSLAAAARRGKAGGEGIGMIETKMDPELQKKQAELAEKERIKAQKRMESLAAKSEQRSGRVLGRGMGGGLSIDDLEGGRRALGSTRKRPVAAQGPRARRRRAEYDSDDDDLPRGARNKEDEYDLEDDFLATSDEEGEEAEGDGDEDEEEEEDIDDGSEPDERRAKKSKKESQRSHMPRDDADADAEGDVDNDVDDGAAPAAEVTAARGKRRNVIEDDDDEDE